MYDKAITIRQIAESQAKHPSTPQRRTNGSREDVRPANDGYVFDAERGADMVLDDALWWTVDALLTADAAPSVNFFQMDSHRQFLAIESLRTLARLATRLADVDEVAFLAASTREIRAWLSESRSSVL